MTPSKANRKRILILDDDSMIAATLGSHIENQGQEYQSATTLDEFFHLVDSWLPDIVLVDLKLQDADALSAFKELEQRNTTSAVIIMSGLGHKILDSAAEAAKERGLNVIGRLNKPFSLDELDDLLIQAPSKAQTRQSFSATSITAEDLQHALSNGDIYFVVQPKFSSKTGNLTGFEALARWQHVSLGFIPPDRFIALAESANLIDDLTKAIFKPAINWFSNTVLSMKGNREYFHLADTLSLAVNLSARSVPNEELFEWFYECCAHYNIDASRVIFELTESSALEDVATSLDNLTRIRLRGFSLSLDDFGTGFSSLQQLVKLPFSELKIDKTFVINSEHSHDATSVIEAAVSLAVSMGMRVIAEGVETEKSLKRMANLGCDLIQGYFTGRPMLQNSVESWLESREGERRARQSETARQFNQVDFSQNHKIGKILQLTSAKLNVPTVLVTSLESEQQVVLFGSDDDRFNVVRSQSICSTTIKSDDVFVIEDTHMLDAFSACQMAIEPLEVRFYAGKSYLVNDCTSIGALCAIDYVPRSIDNEMKRSLAVLADCLGREISREAQQGFKPRQKFSDIRIRKFRDEASVLWEFSSRMNLQVGLILFKLNGLEDINFRIGREAGDNAIRLFDDILMSYCRPSDAAGRYRGAYFAILTPVDDEKSGTMQLNGVSDSIYQKLSNQHVDSPGLLEHISVRLSVHICDAAQHASFESVLEDAIDYL